jgi:AcrR family transcriptional regulator
MLSIGNVESPDIGDRILAAAASCVLDFGVERVTLAEIARRAGVSRPTVYRRWPDTRTILADLMTQRITEAWREFPLRGQGRPAVVTRIVEAVEYLRADEVIRTIFRAAPDLAMIYIVDRLGTSQQIVIDAIADELRIAQADGDVRPGDPRGLAAMVLLIVQSVFQSGQIVEPILGADGLSTELTYALNGYLAP